MVFQFIFLSRDSKNQILSMFHLNLQTLIKELYVSQSERKMFLLNAYRCLFLSTAFMTFDNVPEDHINYFSTFQAQNPGRFLSCLRKEMALLMHSLPAGIIVRGYENRVVSFFPFSTFVLG